MKKCNFKATLILLLMSYFFLFLGCGSGDKSESDQSDTSSVSAASALSPEDQVEAVLNEAMDRLRYRDKSFIYENEFRYYRDRFTFDDYLKESRIAGAQADTLEFIDVLSAEFFGQDSVVVNAEIHFKGPSGKETVKIEKGLALYWHEGKWIKPTVSNIIAQKEYEAIIEKAKSAIENEKQGSGK